jgi:hypothetical protein
VSAPEQGGLSEVLHELWLRVHIRRFDGQDYPDGRPDYVSEQRAVDCFCAGVLKSQHIIEEFAREHGIDRVYDKPATRLAAVPAAEAGLRAAVEGLADLSAAATPGPWKQVGGMVWEEGASRLDYPAAERCSVEDAALIVAAVNLVRSLLAGRGDV